MRATLRRVEQAISGSALSALHRSAGREAASTTNRTGARLRVAATGRMQVRAPRDAANDGESGDTCVPFASAKRHAPFLATKKEMPGTTSAGSRTTAVHSCFFETRQSRAAIADPCAPEELEQTPA